MNTLISLLITCVILGLICYVLFWALDRLQLPEPFGKVIATVVALLIVIYLLGMLVGAAPVITIR